MDTEKFLQAQIARRKQAGLWIKILREDGTEFDCYPKDQATKARWIDGYQKKGITILVQ